MEKTTKKRAINIFILIFVLIYLTPLGYIVIKGDIRKNLEPDYRYMFAVLTLGMSELMPYIYGTFDMSKYLSNSLQRVCDRFLYQYKDSFLCEDSQNHIGDGKKEEVLDSLVNDPKIIETQPVLKEECTKEIFKTSRCRGPKKHNSF